jgi:hypothetical protein
MKEGGARAKATSVAKKRSSNSNSSATPQTMMKELYETVCRPLHESLGKWQNGKDATGKGEMALKCVQLAIKLFQESQRAVEKSPSSSTKIDEDIFTNILKTLSFAMLNLVKLNTPTRETVACLMHSLGFMECFVGRFEGNDVFRKFIGYHMQSMAQYMHKFNPTESSDDLCIALATSAERSYHCTWIDLLRVGLHGHADYLKVMCYCIESINGFASSIYRSHTAESTALRRLSYDLYTMVLLECDDSTEINTSDIQTRLTTQFGRFLMRWLQVYSQPEASLADSCDLVCCTFDSLCGKVGQWWDQKEVTAILRYAAHVTSVITSSIKDEDTMAARSLYESFVGYLQCLQKRLDEGVLLDLTARVAILSTASVLCSCFGDIDVIALAICIDFHDHIAQDDSSETDSDIKKRLHSVRLSALGILGEELLVNGGSCDRESAFTKSLNFLLENGNSAAVSALLHTVSQTLLHISQKNTGNRDDVSSTAKISLQYESINQYIESCVHEGLLSPPEARVYLLSLRSELLWTCGSDSMITQSTQKTAKHQQCICSEIQETIISFDPSAAEAIGAPKVLKKSKKASNSRAKNDSCCSPVDGASSLRLILLLCKWEINGWTNDLSESQRSLNNAMVGYALKTFRVVISMLAKCDDQEIAQFGMWKYMLHADIQLLYHLAALQGRLKEKASLLTLLGEVLKDSPKLEASLGAVLGELQVLEALQSSLLNVAFAPLQCTDKRVERVFPLCEKSSNSDFGDHVASILSSRHGFQTFSLAIKYSNQTDMLLHAWVSVLAAHRYLHEFGNQREAFQYAWKALAYCNSVFPNEDTVGRRRVCVAHVEAIWPRLEAILVIAEIYEQSGDVEKALCYTSELVAMSKCGFSALGLVAELHCLRIWHRLRSNRLELCLEGLREVDENCVDAMINDVGKLTRKEAAAIASLLGIDDDDYDDIRDSRQRPFSTIRKESTATQTSFRRVQAAWDSNHLYHTSMSGKLRRDLKRIYAYLENAQEGGKYGKFDGKELSASMKNVLDECTHSLCFDVVRDMRRLAFVLRLGLSGVGGEQEAADPYAYILGAASISSSVECALDKHQACSELKETSRSEPFPKASENWASISQQVRQACSGNADAVSKINSALSRFTNSRQQPSVVFLILEKLTNQLLIGRWDTDAASPRVISLPIAHKLSKLVERWRDIMDVSKRSLEQTMDVKVVEKWDEEEKRRWWDCRLETDKDIKAILQELQDCIGKGSQYLSPLNTSNDVTLSKSLSIPTEVGEGGSESKKPTKKSKKLSASKTDIDSLTASFEGLSVVELRQKLQAAGLTTQGKKSQLIERLQQFGANAASATMEFPVTKKNDSNNTKCHDERIAISSEGKGVNLASSGETTNAEAQKPHTVLLLDEVLQELPWESLPILRNSCCSRVPGLTALLCLVQQQGCTHETTIYRQDISSEESNISCCDHDSDSGSDSNCSSPNLRGWAVVDPESNLSRTRETMNSFLRPHIDKWGWPAYIGERPSSAAFKAHHEASDLFVYCGHGSGDGMCDGLKLRKTRCPTALLWGCSSGKLEAQGVHDARGVVLSYLLGGSPLVIGNLWDVTDKDIDKLAVSTMTEVFQDYDAQMSQSVTAKSTKMCITVNSESVPRALVEAREKCKMQYAVGCAPVVYGIPKVDIV